MWNCCTIPTNGVAKSWTWLSDGKTNPNNIHIYIYILFYIYKIQLFGILLFIGCENRKQFALVNVLGKEMVY